MAKEFLPKRYYEGLSKTQKIKRKQEIKKFGKMDWKDPKAYVGFSTNRHVQTKPSSYVQTLKKKFQALKKKGTFSLKEKAAITGVPYRFLKESYDRGLAAWRTGHRPGANPQQWGHARVASLLTCGKTYHTADSDIVRKAKRTKRAKQWWKDCVA